MAGKKNKKISFFETKEKEEVKIEEKAKKKSEDISFFVT
jgi:hypothetical protein